MKDLLLLLIGLVFLSARQAQNAPENMDQPMVVVADTNSLPIQQFTVMEKDRKILLRWKSDSLALSESFYAVEKSSNGIDFSMVGITKGNTSGWTEFSDESPAAGKIFYRVKLSTGQHSFYSEMIATNPPASISCRFYPNPVDKVLIIRSESAVEFQINDRFGKLLMADKFAAGLKVVDVSALEPGIYVITLFQKETGRQLTEKLVKK